MIYSTIMLNNLCFGGPSQSNTQTLKTGGFATIPMTANWLKNRLLNANRFYQHENTLFHLAAQTVICLAVVHIRLQRGSLPAPILLIGVLLFSILLWHTPKAKPWQIHLYLAIQCLLACLVFTQDILYSYLFLILAGQAILLLRIQTGLIWTGIFVLLTLFGNFYLHPGDLLLPPSRAVLVTIGFIASGILSNGIARARRDRNKINCLLEQVSEDFTRLQEHAKRSELLAESEERNRLSKELHHTLGQRLTVVIVQVEGAALLIEQEPQRVAEILKTMHGQLTEGLSELRRTIQEL